MANCRDAAPTSSRLNHTPPTVRRPHPPIRRLAGRLVAPSIPQAQKWRPPPSHQRPLSASRYSHSTIRPATRPPARRACATCQMLRRTKGLREPIGGPAAIGHRPILAHARVGATCRLVARVPAQARQAERGGLWGKNLLGTSLHQRPAASPELARAETRTHIQR